MIKSIRLFYVNYKNEDNEFFVMKTWNDLGVSNNFLNSIIACRDCTQISSKCIFVSHQKGKEGEEKTVLPYPKSFDIAITDQIRYCLLAAVIRFNVSVL